MAKIIGVTFAEDLRVGWKHLCFALLIIGAVQNKHFCFLYRFLEPYNNATTAVAVQKAHREKNRKTMLGGNGVERTGRKTTNCHVRTLSAQKKLQEDFFTVKRMSTRPENNKPDSRQGKNPGVYEKVNLR